MLDKSSYAIEYILYMTCKINLVTDIVNNTLLINNYSYPYSANIHINMSILFYFILGNMK